MSYRIEFRPAAVRLLIVVVKVGDRKDVYRGLK